MNKFTKEIRKTLEFIVVPTTDSTYSMIYSKYVGDDNHSYCTVLTENVQKYIEDADHVLFEDDTIISEYSGYPCLVTYLKDLSILSDIGAEIRSEYFDVIYGKELTEYGLYFLDDDYNLLFDTSGTLLNPYISAGQSDFVEFKNYNVRGDRKELYKKLKMLSKIDTRIVWGDYTYHVKVDPNDFPDIFNYGKGNNTLDGLMKALKSIGYDFD